MPDGLSPYMGGTMNAGKRQEVADRLALLAQQNGGILTPEAVVQDAKKKTSPLHQGCGFEPNDKRAAHKHRLDWARNIIASVRYEYWQEREILAAPMYVHDPRGGNRQGYIPTPVARNDKHIAKEVLATEVKRAINTLRRAQAVAGALDLQDDLEGILAAAGVLLEKVRHLKAA